MEQRKSHCIREIEVDRLSNLPDYTIDQILLRLSLKDAVRTSVLSSKWKHKWATLPCLIFNDLSFPVSSSELVNIIDHVLFLHFGPIQVFSLDHKEPLPFHNIDRWILYLSRTTIQQLYLGISDINLGYNIPSCLFSCQNLTLLRLSKCSLRLPSTFEGFVNLKNLQLHQVTLAKDACEKLISSCRVLVALTLWVTAGISHLNVSAPNLKYFTFGYDFRDITFENTPSLSVLSIYFGNRGNSMNLLWRIANLPNIQRLDLNVNFIRRLSNSGSPSPKVPPKFCDNLRVLSVVLDFGLKKNVSRTIYVLRRIPNLQVLTITLNAAVNTVTGDWEEDVPRNCSFVKLQRMKIKGVFMGIPNEMDFIKYMLSTSPALERLSIVPHKDCNNKLKLVKELLCFERASPEARIVLLDS